VRSRSRSPPGQRSSATARSACQKMAEPPLRLLRRTPTKIRLSCRGILDPNGMPRRQFQRSKLGQVRVSLSVPSAEVREVPAGQLRFAPDSPLEGDGFEPSVPRRWPPNPPRLSSDSERVRRAHSSMGCSTKLRFAADSLLEGDGFEPSVPSERGSGRAAPVRLRWSPEQCPGAARRSWRQAPDEVGPPVRIPFAPAGSQERTVRLPAISAPMSGRIPAELRRIVEFLNKQMNPAEVLALELRQFEGGRHGI
jgi:hypothetical protein